MNLNYDLKMEQIILENNGKVKTLLLHSCCAPCSSAVLERLASYFKITIYYYNPNITNKEEYLRRVEEQQRLISELETKYPISFLEGTYEPLLFLEMSKGLEQLKEGGERCNKCYYMRLENTASKAKEKGYDYFTTTLSISPYKNALKLNKIGEFLEQQYGVKYLYADFKKKNGYKRSIELSKFYHLYRQDYCGCIYSEKERGLKNENL